ncbi:T9SS type A sorting domain-containing protein [Dyadobacter sp. CY323]|uniref:T9SS type A sorting domain-containing protein n=1 Tax=Dyadobacter sp. CY323 TaxID=2907302 RepID=UPI001F328C15|nr:T9SS type A sorting domain-containing protein [Dyadobacter sp. CY323]MCE6991755.1 T9SS type A sorting domain-containing protein [Dyadobacter sp. CY323]
MKTILYMLLGLLYLGAQAQNIDRAEYFVDADPGVGKATNVPVGSAGELVNLNFTMPTNSLANGFHNLYFRVRYETGIWGLYEKRMFYVAAAPADAENVTAAEYFIDADPGVGKGVSLTTASGGNVQFSGVISLNELPAGFHNLYIRVKSGGRWGFYEKRMFYISAPGMDVTNIASAEYFIDSDPGLGNASPLALTSGGPQITQTFSIQVPVGTTDGKHYLFIRTKNAAGKWSLYERAEFTVDGSLPVTGMELTARSLPDQTALLKWFTYTEINNSHFDVERSKNGLQFEKIGEVEGNGTTSETMYYQFTDSNPLPGMNYYRLKQVDLDGTESPSRIVYVLFSDTDKETVLFPNPASDYVNVSYEGNEAEVLISIYNSNGQCLKTDVYKTAETIQVDLHTFSPGIYHVMLTDGIRKSILRFVKR